MDKSELLFSNRALLALFIPLVISLLLEFVLGFADSIMVATLGESAISGVSLVDSLMQFLIFAFSAIGSGGAVIAGQYLGHKEIDKACDACDQLIWFAGLFSLVVMLFVYVFRTAIFSFLFGQISAEVWSHANVYLMIVMLTVPFIAVYNSGAAIFRTMGNAKIPMIIMVICDIINILGNAYCIYILGWGVEGVAIPTLIARIISTLIMLTFVANEKYELHISKRLKPNFDKELLKKVLNVGLPYGVENGLFQLGRILVMSLVSTLGTAAIAANAVGNTIAIFGVLPGFAINMGITAVISRCVGAGDFNQAKYYNKKLILIVYISHFFTNIALLLLLPTILGIYNMSDYTSGLVTEIIIWNAVFSVIIWPIAYTLPGTFRGSGDARYPMYVSIAVMFICRIGLAYVFVWFFDMNVIGTWFAMFVDWFVRAGLYVYRYFSGKWMEYRAVSD
ncbi:MAG: MATE family efflux transporter [Methanobacteriaceae archaeon]|nr:MATE family efflux transporter [Methanobacteriaceae archaeon]